MIAIGLLFVRILCDCFKSRRRLEAEILILRHQLNYVLFFIHLESRRVDIAGITVHPDERWMRQMARNVGQVS